MINNPQKGDTIRQIGRDKDNFIILEVFSINDFMNQIPITRVIAMNKNKKKLYFELTQIKIYSCLLVEIIKNEN